MTDIRADEATPLDDEDRLPWLEAVDEEGENEGPSPLKLIVAVLIGLVAIGGIVGGLFWLGNRDAAEHRDAELIAAPEGDYKVRPDDPGGMNIQGEGDTAFAASEGADPNGQINTNALPEAPVTQAPKQTPPQVPAAQPAPQAPPAPAAAGVTIQLGAFSSQAGATNAWKALSGRFSYLAPLSHTIIPTSSGGRTLYRLRASGGDARNICNRLRIAGEACTVVD
ncbi:SPOR domain-containing protein [Sphingosinicella rhizophila]|uniref:SPOR domain-containing protein n=1 Tax=Sphingosinicella rhizophila TaxID=3050082 RepID=A0ABU3Q3R4_9SPHN|nr:SPOR domain-containing protein [Sphingosinicella sp. GR2756]MDT9598053.1 SPOR domain-containing protein [Sphingosinicella sp. GR2756]